MAKVNQGMVERVALRIKELSLQGMALTFTEEDKFPPVGDPGALDYVFAVTMHDYGFWLGDEKGYVKPLYGEVGGKKLKGSDLLWTLSMKMYRERGPEFFNPNSLAKLQYEQFIKWLPEEYGFQDMITRYGMTVEYGQDCRSFNKLSHRVETLTQVAHEYLDPLGFFLDVTATFPGYNKDPLFKKNLLLAMILANRPEKFLKIGPDEKWPPIVDYHLMRLALRLGIVDVSQEEYEKLSSRVWVSVETEQSVRDATYEAVRMVIELSGKPMSEIDFLMWSARRYCPEMTVPDCPKCVFTDVCQKRVDLFQPVFRTTNY